MTAAKKALARNIIERTGYNESRANLIRKIDRAIKHINKYRKKLPKKNPDGSITPYSGTVDGHRKLLANFKKALRGVDKNVGLIDKKIANNNRGIAVLVTELAACEKIAKEMKEKAAKIAGKGIWKCCKKGVGFLVRKTPLVLVTFTLDSCSGGLQYAVDETTWPLSELWTGQGNGGSNPIPIIPRGNPKNPFDNPKGNGGKPKKPYVPNPKNPFK